MQSIDNFAAGGSSSQRIRWEPYLEKVIEDYMESNSVLRQLCNIYKLEGTYIANLPKSTSTGNAVEIVEGAEIPAVRQVIGTVDVKVSANGTAIQMTDNAKKVDHYGNLAEREAEEALRRMLRKENADIASTLIAGAGNSDTAGTSGTLKFEDIVDAKTELKKLFYEPDILLVNPDQYADIVKAEEFRDVSKSDSTAPLREGTIGGKIAGLYVIELPEIPTGTAIIMDTSANPLWLVVLQELEIEAYRIPERRMDRVDMTAYQKPAVLKADAIYKITSC